jgi:UDPglucose 6-dehydrogenase
MAATIGVVGLGKLGLPIAVTLALQGHEVIAYDRDSSRMDLAALSALELGPDATSSLRACINSDLPLRFASLDEMLSMVDCVFVVVDTPHGPAFEGITPLPDSRSDFGYASLVAAVRSIVDIAPRPMEIGIMSTVLPGTIRSQILPLVGEHPLVYCPQFVAMGQVATDLLRPEFTLLGCGEQTAVMVPEILGGLGSAKRFVVSYETAELAKVVYNTFVSAKVTVSNLVQWIAHETGADALDVFRILRSADQRLTSDAYLGPGMGDGGPCHPRDNIALSWLFRQKGAGADLFTDVMRARQAYVEWLGNLFREYAGGLPLVLLGTAFKPGSDIQTGSSAVLMATLLNQAGAAVTVASTKAHLSTLSLPASAAAFFIGCPEPDFVGYPFPPGSVVVDPWCVVPDLDGVRVHRVGAGPVAYGQS